MTPNTLINACIVRYNRITRSSGHMFAMYAIERFNMNRGYIV